MKKAPIPKKIKKTLTLHKDVRIDWYYWLRDDQRKNKKVLNYLQKENKYTDQWFEKFLLSIKNLYQRLRRD